MFYCKCGYYTCKKSYKTKRARTQHLAGVQSAKTKKIDPKSTNNKNSKIEKMSTTEKVHYIAKWATTMTKWKISHVSKKQNRWRYVDFRGKKGESAGIIDILAIRRQYKKYQTKPDNLDIILLQIKGSATNPKSPTANENRRLRSAGKSCNAKKIVLSRYTYQKEMFFYELNRNNKWKPSDPKLLFK